MFNWFKNSATGKVIVMIVFVAMVATLIFPIIPQKTEAAIPLILVGIGKFLLTHFALTLTVGALSYAAITIQDCNPAGGNLSKCIAGIISNVLEVVTKITGYIIVSVGAFFDLSLEYSLKYFSELANADFIKGIWSLIRDICNIFFIFILVYIGIATMLGIGGDTKKMLINVVVAAVLINFSWSISRAVIDVSNVATVDFYNQMSSSSETVSQRFSRIFRVAELVDPSTIKDPGSSTKKLLESSLAQTAFAVMAFKTVNLLVLFMLLVVFITGGILFLIRTVVLIFVIIFSPIAFLAYCAPSTLSSFWSKWWGQLVNQAFFAPVFVFLLLLTTVVAESLYASVNKELSAIMGAPGSSTSPSLYAQMMALTLFGNLLIMGFLAATVASAKAMGAVGASYATKIGTGATMLGAGAMIWGAKKFGNATGVPQLAGKAIDRLEGDGTSKWRKGLGTQLRNLPKYGRDIGQSGIDALGGAAKSFGADILPTTAAQKELRDMGKSGTEYQKSLAKERLDAQMAANIKQSTKDLNDLDKHFMTDDQIDEKSKDNLGTIDETKKGELLAARMDAQAKAKQIMSALGASGVDQLPEHVLRSSAGLHGLSSAKLKKMRETMSNDQYYTMLNKKAANGDAKGAAGALEDDDIVGMKESETTDALRKGMSGKQLDMVFARKDLYGSKTSERTPTSDEVADKDGYIREKKTGKVAFNELKQLQTIQALKGSQLTEMDATLIEPHIRDLTTGQYFEIASKKGTSFSTKYKEQTTEALRHQRDALRTSRTSGRIVAGSDDEKLLKYLEGPSATSYWGL